MLNIFKQNTVSLNDRCLCKSESSLSAEQRSQPSFKSGDRVTFISGYVLKDFTPHLIEDDWELIVHQSKYSSHYIDVIVTSKSGKFKPYCVSTDSDTIRLVD